MIRPLPQSGTNASDTYRSREFPDPLHLFFKWRHPVRSQHRQIHEPSAEHLGIREIVHMAYHLSSRCLHGERYPVVLARRMRDTHTSSADSDERTSPTVPSGSEPSVHIVCSACTLLQSHSCYLRINTSPARLQRDDRVRSSVVGVLCSVAGSRREDHGGTLAVAFGAEDAVILMDGDLPVLDVQAAGPVLIAPGDA